MYFIHNIGGIVPFNTGEIQVICVYMRSVVFFFCVVGILSCRTGPKDINADEDIEGSDFILSFPERQLPIQYADRDFSTPSNDSFFIKSSVLTRFIPDSIFQPDFKSLEKVKFYRKARYKAEETEETYLFLQAESKNKKSIYLICFDPENRYSAALQMLTTKPTTGGTTECSMDKKLTVYKNTTRTDSDKKTYYNKSAYVYNTEGLFTLILTESNEPPEKETIYNPIDTLASSDPLSGDYTIDENNFVSVRDGSKKGRLQFFINISKSNGKCTGSLRGDITQVRNKVYHYNKADDHCIIEFLFNGKRLQVKELEACGNHRGLRCSFDGKFNKQ